MARAGLGPDWTCLFANDFDIKKGAVYADNWGDDVLKTEDVRNLAISDLPGCAAMAWASFPCQDLSLAGMGAGLQGDRSGTFWPFWRLIQGLQRDKRPPRVIVLENVCGTLTSHKGADFVALAGALADAGYRFGGLIVDAADFLAHSRPRLFIIAVLSDIEIPTGLLTDGQQCRFHTPALRAAHARLPTKVRTNWVWWNMPCAPQQRASRLADLIEDNPTSVVWHSASETRRLLAMMSAVNLKKVAAARRQGVLMVGSVYRRTRLDENGVKVQRAEVRFDDVAGCLRTPAGGSSRQVIMVVEGRRVRSRLLSIREAARLMGLPDSYRLPVNYNEAYHLTGDGVVVPVVRHIAANVLEPLLAPSHEEATYERRTLPA